MPARGSQVGAADEALQITEFLSHAFVRLKGSGEEGGAAGNAPAAFSEIWGSAGMGKIGRSYPRFDETLVDDGGGEPSVTALEVVVGLLVVFLALGLVGLLLAFPPS